MSSVNSNTTAIQAASAIPPRLIDQDRNTTIFLKKVVVITAPGVGTRGISEALRSLGYKVYDAAAAVNDSERDFALWLEAAELRAAGKPYDRYDFEKFLGKYDAIVGGLPMYFAEDIARAFWYEAKFIVVHTEQRSWGTSRFRKWANSAVLASFQPTYFRKLFAILDVVGEHATNLGVIHEIVHKKNLLEIGSDEDVKVMFDFLNHLVPHVSKCDIRQDLFDTLITERLRCLITYVGTTVLCFVVNCAITGSVVTAGLAYGSVLSGNDPAPIKLIGCGLLCLAAAALLLTADVTTKPDAGVPIPAKAMGISKQEPSLSAPAPSSIKIKSVPPHLRHKTRKHHVHSYKGPSPRRVRENPASVWGDFRSTIRADDDVVIATNKSVADAIDVDAIEYNQKHS